ncbi:glycosyltransferase family 39 protein [Nonomuraea rhizosphaerae]|uniref:glycosyltransferase family 39 protein n=1 Tax=Nonomuraea rhizosphaerae TaxID=2665663 RepID=UPI0027E33588|nr:glycosyltransferase family 39 protein [Nonomuraea rhizosphaerae]
MTTAATLTPPARPAVRPRRSSPWWLAGIAGIAAFSGSGSSSLNGDELATISAASRSLPGLWELSQHIDGHFLPYYLFMQLWVQGGTAELWLRLPSAIAIGVAAWFLVDLGRRLHSTWAGVTAGAVFAVLPSVAYYGAFARSYAPAAAAVVLSFWALHRLAETRRGWVLYGVAVALVCCTHLFAVLVLPAQLIAAVALLPRRDLLLRWAPALAAGCLPALVLGLIGYGERHAISWIPQRGPEVLLKFPKMAAGATEPGVLLFAVALAGVVLLRRRAWAMTLLGWLVLPPVLLLAVSHLVTPVYVDRYLFVTAPALALLAGIAVASVPRGAVVACCALVVVTVGLGVPQHIEVREANGRFEDFPGAVSRVQSRPDDAIVFGQSSVRAGFDYYDDGPPPLDVLRQGPDPEPDGFGFPERSDVAAALEGRERVWVVWRGVKSAGARLARVKAVLAAGYEQATAWHSAETPGLTVALYTRK